MPINKVVLGSTTLIDLSNDDVSSSADIRADKYGHLKNGERVRGTLKPRPAWISEGDSAVWTVAYMNPAVPWETVLPTLVYDERNTKIVGVSAASSALWSGLFFAVKKSSEYALIYVCSTAPTPIWASAAGSYTAWANDEDSFTVTCAAGWNNTEIAMPSGTTSCGFLYGLSDSTQVAAGAEIAFGDFIPTPTGTLNISANGDYAVSDKASVHVAVSAPAPTPGSSITITANGTYTWEQLSQYATIIVDVPTAGGSENQSVSGDTLSFDGDTAVSGDTLVLASDATFSGDTLAFTGSADAAVSGNDLIFDGDEAVSGDTMTLDGTVTGDTLIL